MWGISKQQWGTPKFKKFRIISPDLELYNGALVPPESLPLKEFVLLFKPSWGDSLVIYHPEYCYYTYCMTNASSNAYDEAMMRISAFQEAYDAGYLNPVYNYGYGSFPAGNEDPYFAIGGDGNGFITEMANDLFHYVDLPGYLPDRLSAWAFAMSVATNADNAGTYYLTVNDTTYNAQCPGNLNTAWTIFRNAYQTLKYKYFDLRREDYVNNNGQGNGLTCLSNLCMSYNYQASYIGSNFSWVDGNYCSDQDFNPAGYIPRVIHYEAGLEVNSMTDAADILAEVQQNAADSLASSCSDACEGQTDYWIQKLSGCTMSAAQEADLRAGFIEVCLAGCDYTHPLGATTTPDGVVTANGFTSFEDVVVQVMNVSPTDVFCNAIIIDSPGPYEAQQNFSSGYLFYQKDECLCEKFSSLQDSFNLFGGYATLAEFINAHYESSLSQEQADEILALCNDAACNFLSAPITLSLALSCDSNGCITCEEYRTKDASFKQLYPDSNFANYESYYAGYMNQAFGFNLSYVDYQSFGSECSVASAGNNGGGVSNGYGDPVVVNDSMFNNMVITAISFSLDSMISIASHVICDTILLPLDTIISSMGNEYTYDTLITCDDTTYHFIDSIQAMPFGSMVVSQTVTQSYVDAVTGLLVQNTISLNAPAVPGESDSNSIPPPVFLPKLCGGTYTVAMDTTSCEDQLMNMAITNGMTSYQNYLDSVKQEFADLYRTMAMEATETFTVTKPFDEYHYTLYYYDLPGNLVKTVPPAGVKFLTEVQMDSTALHRSDSSAAIFPAHTLFSRYWYNSLNVPVKQLTPDADSVRFWYDRLGRIAVSQSGKQRPNYFSYTLYDGLGRTVEVGRITQSTMMSDATSKVPDALLSWIEGGQHEQVTHTFFDVPPVIISQFTQVNLRNRVTCIEYEEKEDGNNSTYQSAIFYSYDIAGNVKSMYYDVKELKPYGQANKRIDYDYDLVSGKVNRVYYQKDSIDQFIYKYSYDASNRLTNAYTSRDGYLWDQDADYQYYDHGPLGRMQLGQRQVQGVDYAYTIQGWMKSVNGAILDSTHDMGYDGLGKNIHSQFPKDIYGFVIGYFNGDYSPVGNTHFEPKYAGSTFESGSPSLYNGNIRNMTASIASLSPVTVGYAYAYDQLNRYTGMSEYENFNASTYKWKTNGTATNKWKEKVTYDPNGNILSYLRHGNAPTAMDSLSYLYNQSSNQLNHVDDGISATNYSVDIDDQNSDNYLYDKSGALTTDVQEGLNIDWTNYGKVKTVSKTVPGKITIDFTYDPLGNRLSKKVTPFKKSVTTTYYFRDALGNILSTYQLNHPTIFAQGQQPKDSIFWLEQDLYGSSRIGIAKPVKAVTYPKQKFLGDTGRITYYAGWKQYELTNHLGNVLATVSDKKIGVGTGATISYYKAELMSAQDYYPFGMLEPGRSYSTPNYRFGFNGQEKDDEIKSVGNAYNFGNRIYDPRVGRWLSVDPLANQVPGWTPYRSFFNNPNYWIDLDGNIEWPLKGTNAKNKKDLKAGENTANTVIRTSTYREIRNIGTSPHIGIDYRASIGTPFYSLGDGTVTDVGKTKSGIKYITIEYAEGDKVRFLHLSEVADGIEVGTQVLEGQSLGKSGNSGTYNNKKGEKVNYPAHLHIDAVDKDGNKINPEGKNYGDHTNAELFTTYGGDYTQLPGNYEIAFPLPKPILNLAPADATRVALPTIPFFVHQEEGN